MRGWVAGLLCGALAGLLAGGLALAQQDRRAHVVQPGDTLLSIGQRYGVSPWELRAANGALSPWHVRPGQRLALPAPATVGPVTYRAVQARPGDTVAAIARRYGVAAWDLARANGCWQPWLTPGQWLLIPGVLSRSPWPTPTATPTRSVLRTAPATSRPRPTRTPATSPTTTWRYTQDGPVWYESNAGLTRILGVIHDDAGNTVDGVLVQCCTNQCWTSRPSGSCGPGCYDFALGDWSRNCKWLVTIVDENGNPQSPTVMVETTDVGWMSIATLNWRKHW